MATRRSMRRPESHPAQQFQQAIVDLRFPRSYMDRQGFETDERLHVEIVRWPKFMGAAFVGRHPTCRSPKQPGVRGEFEHFTAQSRLTHHSGPRAMARETMIRNHV